MTNTVRVSILGVNAWLATLVWPLGFRDPVRAADIAAVAGALGVLVGGVAALAARRHAVATWVLLGAFPAGTAAVLAARPDDWNRQAHAAPALVLQVLSLLAFAASAAIADAHAASPSPTTRHIPLGPERHDAQPMRPARLGAALALLTCAGAFAIGVLAPILGGPSALEQDWGDTAREGGVLTAVVGASVAVALVTAVTEGLRADGDEAAPRTDVGLRIASLLLLALLGAATWFAIRE